MLRNELASSILFNPFILGWSWKQEKKRRIFAPFEKLSRLPHTKSIGRLTLVQIEIQYLYKLRKYRIALFSGNQSKVNTTWAKDTHFDLVTLIYTSFHPNPKSSVGFISLEKLESNGCRLCLHAQTSKTKQPTSVSIATTIFLFFVDCCRCYFRLFRMRARISVFLCRPHPIFLFIYFRNGIKIGAKRAANICKHV